MLLHASSISAQVPAAKTHSNISINDRGEFSIIADSVQSEANADVFSTYSPYAPKAEVYNDKQPMLKVTMEKEPVKDRSGKPTGKEKTKWFFEIPDSLIGRYFLATTRLAQAPSGCSVTPHQEMTQGMYSFQVSPDEKFLQMKEFSDGLFCDTINTMSKAADISNTEPIINVFKIEKHEKGVYKVEVTSFLMNDRIMSLSRQMKDTYRVAYMNPDASEVLSVHTYPGNVEIRTSRTYATSIPTIASRGGFMTVGLSTSLILLPKEPMQQRLHDPRIGYRYITTPLFSDNQQEVDKIRFITRWRLEPKSSEDAQLQQNGTPIEPKKPVTFYIDPAFPEKWVDYVKNGVAEWQKAFEKAGWKNAISALDWPKNDSTLSIEDSRYNVIRYLASSIPTVTGSAQAYDYRSGELINAAIYFNSGAMQQMRTNYVANCGAVDSDCHTVIFPDELMGALVQHSIARAVATTLGLTENLLASTLTPTESLRSKTYLQQYGMAPSITDQLPYNYVAQPEDGLSRDELIPRVGDGDEWTIEWGYKAFPYTNAEEERQHMVDYTTEHLSQNPRHEFGGRSALNDPTCKANDLGDDQAKAVSYGLKNLKAIAPNLVAWGATNRDIHYQSVNARNYWAQINTKLQEYYVTLANNLTGKIRRNKPVNAPGAVFAYPSKEYVEKCLDGIFELFGEQPTWILSDKTQRFEWTMPEKAGLRYTQNIAGSPTVSMLRQLNPGIGILNYVNRIYEFCFKDAKPGMAPDLYNRTLQSELVNTLIGNFESRFDSSAGPDARPVSRYALKQIQQRLKNALPSAPDATTRTHYTMLLKQLEDFFTIK